ncbi:hypothetical protein ES707_19301 [subsurface metagenome]
MDKKRRKVEKIPNEFNDSDFIPDDSFCESIDDNSPLIVLKYNFDGMICNCHFGKKETEYLELTKQTNNKFLKLVFFECLKSSISIGEQNKILNSEGLIPIFYKVAVNIVKKRNRRYRPMWLAKEFINLAHKSRNPKISNQEMFDNMGKILTLIITDQYKTHIQDISYILNDFLGLKKSILLSATIPEDIFSTIDYWINDIFDGNLSKYDITKHLLDKIFDFYEKVNIDINSRKEIIFKRYKQFFDDKVDDGILDINNIQSIHSHKLFTNSILDITQKFCVNEEIKGKLVNDLKAKYEELNRNAPIAMKRLPMIKSSYSISVKEIENALKPFKNDTIQEFMQKIVINDYFIPDIPDVSNEDLGITSLFPTIVYDDATRKYDAGDPIIMRTFYYKMKSTKFLIYLKHKLRDYDKYEFLGNVYAFIHLSDLIDELSKRIFRTSLEHYGRGDFFHCIQTGIFQIERILRALCEKNGILNLYKGEKKEIPKGLDYMIGKLKEKNVLSDKILFFIGWLFSGSSEIIPENIRNKIAHGISDVDQFKAVYTENNALSIILIYLSLSKS